MLVSETLFGIRNKIDEAIALIKEHEPPEGYYVAFSGGKDSVVVLDLVKKAGVKFDAHYSLEVDPPELVRFIKTFPEIKIEHPVKTMWELIPWKLIPPTRRVRYCCDWLKERGGAGRLVITGIRSEESPNRKGRGTVYSYRKKSFLNPIFFCKENEVWDYIEINNLSYCSLYDDPGLSRLGCILCPMSNLKNRRYEIDRYPKYYQAYLRAFGRMLKERERRGLKTQWQSAQEVMDWWLSQ